MRSSKIESEQPQVSVVIPLYNRESTIDRAIRSVLTQSYENIEIVVVDDGSTDNSIAEVSNYSSDDVKLIRHKTNKGGSAARNTGIQRSTGKYVAFLDSDDAWHYSKIEKQITLLELKSGNYIGSYCNTEYSGGNLFSQIIKNKDKRANKPEDGKRLQKQLLTLDLKLGGSSTLVVKKDAINKVGGFDESFRRHQDWEFVLRLADYGDLLHIPEPLVIKFSSGSPSAEVVETENRRYLRTFMNKIESLDIQTLNVYQRHNLFVASSHMRDGSVTKSLHLLLDSKSYKNGALNFLKAIIDRLSDYK